MDGSIRIAFCAFDNSMIYTDSVLVSAGLIGTIMLALRLADGVSDIIFVAMIEKTHTRLGKARPWFGGSIIPLVAIQLLVYNVPSGLSYRAKLVWIIVTYFLLTVVAYTINNLSYHAMLSRISLDPGDRNKVSSVRGIFAFPAGLLLSILTPILLKSNGGSNERHAWMVTALVFSIACLVLESITFFCVKEKILSSAVYIAGCVVGIVGARKLVMVLIATVITGLGLAPYVADIFYLCAGYY